jgi:hypothetical protein
MCICQKHKLNYSRASFQEPLGFRRQPMQHHGLRLNNGLMVTYNLASITYCNKAVPSGFCLYRVRH